MESSKLKMTGQRGMEAENCNGITSGKYTVAFW